MDVRSMPVFVTWRVADSVPDTLLRSLGEELIGMAEDERASAWRKRISDLLDEGHGTCPLRDSKLAGIVQDALIHYDPLLYELLAWVVMPNHVHAVLLSKPEVSTAALVGRIKSYTSKAINKSSGVAGRFWQEDYFDRQITSEAQLGRVVEYVEYNPVKSGLVTDSRHWRYSSANSAAFARLQSKRAESSPGGTPGRMGGRDARRPGLG